MELTAYSASSQAPAPESTRKRPWPALGPSSAMAPTGGKPGTPGSRPGAASAAKKASAATPAAAAGSIGGGGGAAATPEPAAALAASRPELSVGHLPPSEQPTTAAQAPIDSSSLQGAGDGSGRSSGRSSASGVHSAAALPTGLSAAALKPQQKSVVGEKRQSWPQSASPAVLLRAQKGQKGAQHSRSGVAAGAAAYPWLNDLGQHYVDCFRQELLEEQQLDEAFADGLAAEYAAELKGEEEFCRPGSCACCRVAASSRRRQAWRQQQ